MAEPSVADMRAALARLSMQQAAISPLAEADPRKASAMEDVPFGVRVAVASAKSDADKLATLKQYYPDAVIRRSGGETVVNGQPAYFAPREDILFTHPGSSDRPDLKGQLMRYDPHWWDPANLVAAVGGILPNTVDPGSEMDPNGARVPGGAHPEANNPEFLGAALGVPDTRSAAAKTATALNDVAQVPLALATGEGGARASTIATQALERGGAARLAGKEAAAGGMGRGEVLDAMERQGLPLEGGAPLVTASRNVQGKFWQLLRNPKSADPIRNALDSVDTALERVFNESLDATGGRAMSKGQVGAGVQSSLGDLEQHVMKGGPAGEGLFRGLRNQQTLEDAAATSAGGAKGMAPVGALRDELVNMKDVASAGTDKASRGLFPEDLQDILTKIDANGGQLPMDYLRKIRSWMGENGGAHTLLPASRPELEQLYGAATDDLGKYYQAKGGKAFDYWEAGQTNYRDWAQRRDALRDIASSRQFEQAADVAARGGTDAKTGLSKLNVLTESLGPQELADLKRMKLSQLGMQGQGETAEFNLNTFLKGWKNSSDEMKGWLTADKPELRQSLDDLYTVGQARQDFMGARDPGTAGAIEQQKSLKGQALDLLLAPITVPARAMGESVGILGPAAKARLMTNPDFVRWLAQGGKLPMEGSRLAAHIARLGTMVAGMKGEQETQQALQSYVSNLRDQMQLDSVPAAPPGGAPGVPGEMVASAGAAAKPSVREQLEAEARKAGVRVRGKAGK